MPPASTWFDIIAGFDLHYEVVPGSPTPVPFPHSFLGLIYDPVGAVVEEMLSATAAWATDTPRATGPVLINGKMATVTGDEAKMPTGHVLIPPGVSWFPMPKVPAPGGKGPSLPEPPAPPPGDAMLVFGSKTVEIRGGKAVRLGDPALSCSDPVRLPTSLVLPSGGPSNVMIGGPTTLDWASVAFAVGFGAIRTKKLSDLAHAAITRFVPKHFKRARSFLHDAACFVTGHPVNVVNGGMFTTWSDFELPGPIPLTFSRRYRSNFCDRDFALGYGWSHNLDQRLWIEDDWVVYLTEDGRELEFDVFYLPDHVMRKGDEIFDPISRFTLRSLGDFRWEVEAPGGLTHEFGPIRGETTKNRDRRMARLTRIRNRSGDAIELRYDERACLSEVTDSGGRLLRFDHDRNGHLEYIWLPASNGDGLRQHARFLYSPEGDLVETQDAMGKSIEFEYDRHTLVRETDRNGLNFGFNYDGWGPFARCTRTWGDGGIHDHVLTYDVKGRRTIVEDSHGDATVYEWGAHGTVTKIIDAHGGKTVFEYDGMTRKVAETDQLGNTTRYAYDERSNQTKVVDPNGGVTKIRYDEHDQPTWLSTPKGAQWKWAYDRWGQRVSEINPLGQRTRYIHEQGRMIAVENVIGERTSLEYDSAGNVVQLVNVDGTKQQWSYDTLGRVVKTTDAVGNVQRRYYDALGRVGRIDEPDGNVRLLEYDPEGNVVRAKDKLRDVQLGYCGMGKVAWRRIAGTTVRFEYDKEERLTAFINEKAHAYRFERDGLGNVKTEICYDGSKRRYVRDAAGRVTKVRRPGSRRFSDFEYDAAGRTTKVSHHDGSEETFAYDADGALIEASNATIDVKFERDLLGRVVKEHQGEHWIASHYDHQGMRIGMESSLGARQTITRNAMGDVVGLLAKQGEQKWETTITRDALGLEIDRQLPGGARSHWWRDKVGRPTQHWIGRNQELIRRRRYRWSVDDRLHEIHDEGEGIPEEGSQVYEHDGRGFLVSTTHPGGRVELRNPDEVGNLFRTAGRRDREYGRAGELKTERTPEGVRTYSYDPEGNLVRREDPDGGIWVYRWEGTGRLTKVVRSDETEVTFEYDALGRRVGKTTDRGTTKWFWDREVALHELPGMNAVATPKTTTWIFEPNRHSPVARIGPTSTQNVITDHLGAPVHVMDAHGLDRLRFDADNGGKAKTIGDAEGCPWRFPGQYFDKETKLHYNRFRYYDPQEDRYLSRDPIGLQGGTQLYAYVYDPLVSVDPFGLSSRSDYGSYAGAKEASEYLKTMAVGRAKRVDVIESFDLGTLRLEKAGDDLFGLRFFGGRAATMGQYLTETFSPLTNRANLALPPRWNAMTGLRQFQVKPGTTVLRGRTGPQLPEGAPYIGGADQIFVLEPWKYGTLL